MRILALDLSKSRTGFAVDSGTTVPPLTGSIKLYGGGNSRGITYVEFNRWLWAMIGNHDVDMVAYEAPIFGGGVRHKSHEAMLLIGLAAMTEMVARSRNVRCELAPVSTIRVHFIGTARADKPKQAVMAQCKRLGWTPANYDESDACAVFDWAKAKFDRKAYGSATSTPLFGNKAVDMARMVS